MSRSSRRSSDTACCSGAPRSSGTRSRSGPRSISSCWASRSRSSERSSARRTRITARTSGGGGRGRELGARISESRRRVFIRPFTIGAVKKTARLAGVLYLLVVLRGPFVLLYVPGKLFVPGDATATAANIAAHQTLVRAHIVVSIVCELLFIAVVCVLYRLLKGVDAQLAALMVITILIDTPLAFLGVANEVGALAFVVNPEFLSVVDKPQRDALATLLINFDQKGTLVSEVFWGLWLLPLGVLVYRSRFMPRILGLWLFANGLAYVAISLTGLLSPPNQKMVSTIATPLLFGEMA